MENNDIFIESIKRGLEASGSIPGCRIVVSDGTTFFILLADGDKLGCHPGKAVDIEFRLKLKEAGFRWEIARKSLDLLARREHSRFELRMKLARRFLYRFGSPDEFGSDDSEMYSTGTVIDGVLDNLEEQGYLDDLRFARSWAAFRLRRRPEGRSALISGLRSRGVSGTIAGQIAAELTEEGAFDSALKRAGEKILGKSGMREERLIRSLQDRGFSYREVKKWLEEKSAD